MHTGLPFFVKIVTRVYEIDVLAETLDFTRFRLSPR